MAGCSVASGEEKMIDKREEGDGQVQEMNTGRISRREGREESGEKKGRGVLLTSVQRMQQQLVRTQHASAALRTTQRIARSTLAGDSLDTAQMVCTFSSLLFSPLLPSALFYYPSSPYFLFTFHHHETWSHLCGCECYTFVYKPTIHNIYIHICFKTTKQTKVLIQHRNLATSHQIQSNQFSVSIS